MSLMTIQGKIIRYFTVWCATCYEFRSLDAPTMLEAKELAWKLGWRQKASDKKWYCPICKDKHKDKRGWALIRRK
jgi:hypothetical protein